MYCKLTYSIITYKIIKIMSGGVNMDLNLTVIIVVLILSVLTAFIVKPNTVKK